MCVCVCVCVFHVLFYNMLVLNLRGIQLGCHLNVMLEYHLNLGLLFPSQNVLFVPRECSQRK